MNWAAPASNGGAAVHAYTVRYYQTNDETNTAQTVQVDGRSTGLTLDGLTSGTNYNVQIKAPNAHGESTYTTAVTTTPTNPKPLPRESISMPGL